MRRCRSAGPRSSWTAGGINLVAGQALTNTGTFTIDPGPAGLTISGGGTLSNAGTLTYGGSGGLTIPGGATLSNAGTFTYGGAGTLTISTPFVNQGGTIDVASGTLSIASTNCTWSGGNLEAASGATLQLATSGGVGIILTGTFTGSGGGQVQLAGGTLVIGTSGATFDFPQGLFQWQGGVITLNQGGNLTNTGFLTLANTGGIALNGIDTVINKGTVDQTGSGTVAINGATFDNQAGGIYDISGTGVLSGSATFSDEGTLTMTGSGTGTLSVFSDLNGGTIDVASGTLLIQSTNCNWTGGNLEVAAGATLQLANSGGSRNHSDRDVYRLGRGPGSAHGRHPGHWHLRGDLRLSSGPVPVAGRRNHAESGRQSYQHRISHTCQHGWHRTDRDRHGNQQGHSRSDRLRLRGDQRRDFRQPGGGYLRHQRHGCPVGQRHVFRRRNPDDDG